MHSTLIGVPSFEATVTTTDSAPAAVLEISTAPSATAPRNSRRPPGSRIAQNLPRLLAVILIPAGRRHDARARVVRALQTGSDRNRDAARRSGGRRPKIGPKSFAARYPKSA